MIRRVGVSTGGWTERPIFDVLGEFAAIGVRAVEVGTPPRHFDPVQQDAIGSVRARLERSGIRPISIHAPFGGLLDLAEPNPHHRHAATVAILEAARALRALGGELVVVHPSDRKREESDVARALEDCSGALNVVVLGCRELGLRVAVESPLPHLIGGAPDEFKQLLKRLPPEAAVCLDTSHLWLGGHWDAFLALAAGRSLHVHASDNRGVFDDHLPPGDGIIDWGHVGRSLDAAGFDGWVMLELSAPAGPLRPYVERAMAMFERLVPLALQPSPPGGQLRGSREE